MEDLHTLCPFIGPPLKTSFKELYHFSEEQADIAIIKYREYFSEQGIFQNIKYPGIDNILREITENGMKAYLATSKPEPFAKQILEHFNLKSYFSFVGGSTFDGSRSEKADVIQYVLDSNHMKTLPDIVMVGDRKYDIEGAKTCGINSIGVLYGYGSEEELRNAGADKIVANLDELSSFLFPHEQK